MVKTMVNNEGEFSNAIRNVRGRFNEVIANHDAETIGILLAPEYHIVTGRSSMGCRKNHIAGQMCLKKIHQ